MNYFEILGVEVGSSDKEVKRAFRTKARELHPDKNTASDSHSQFHRLQEAYQCLKDQQSRTEYFEAQQAISVRKKQEQSASDRIKKLREELLKREKMASTQKQEPPAKRERTERPPKMLKVRWNSKCSYSEKMISHIFEEYGSIDSIQVYDDHAIVVFLNYLDSEKCMKRPPKEFEVKETREARQREKQVSGVESNDSLIKHRMKLLQHLRNSNNE